MGKNRYSYWVLTIVDTSVEGLLNELTEAEIAFFAARMKDPVTLHCCVPYSQMAQVRAVLQRRGSDLRMCSPKGIFPAALRLSKRTALLVSVLLCGLLLGISNLFVWRIEVTGNDSVLTGAVLRAMEACGAGIGSFWPSFNGEQLKTDLLLRLEDVQWVAVNYGRGGARVVLRERREVPDVVDNDEPVHIIAARDGVIASLSAKRGQTAVGIGDTVERGQLLISGAAVSPIGTTRAVHALGSARGRTWRTMTVRLPTEEVQKRYVGHRSLKISLIFGRNRVNFFRSSSIFGGTCDTITMDYPMCVDGVFSLPVRLTVQRCEYWEPVPCRAEPQPLTERGREALHRQLTECIGEEGTVVSEAYAAQTGADAVTVTVMAECLEELGVEVPISEEELREIQMNNIPREEAVND